MSDYIKLLEQIRVNPKDGSAVVRRVDENGAVWFESEQFVVTMHPEQEKAYLKLIAAGEKLCEIATNALKDVHHIWLYDMSQKFIRLITPKHCIRCHNAREKYLVLPWEVRPTRVF